jgi:hypothetical protein
MSGDSKVPVIDREQFHCDAQLLGCFHQTLRHSTCAAEQIDANDLQEEFLSCFVF